MLLKLQNLFAAILLSSCGMDSEHPRHDEIVDAHSIGYRGPIGGIPGDCLRLDVEASTQDYAVVWVEGDRPAEFWQREANHGSSIIQIGDRRGLRVPI